MTFESAKYAPLPVDAEAIYSSSMELAKPDTRRWSDVSILGLLASSLLLIHFYIGNGYGFHRDELQFLDDARHLAWGYVAYPPITSFMGRLSISLFGISVQAFRLPAMLAGMANLVLTGLIARELGGRRPAQVLAVFAALGSQVILSALMLYVVWDFLAWTLVCFSLAKLLRTQDQRWWLAVGASIGIGILSKYSIAFLAVSIVAGVVVLPSQRRHLLSPWLYLGIVLAMVIALPNLLWEAHHGWVSFKMLSTIHARDVRIGRAKGFLPDQLKYTMVGSLLAVAGVSGLCVSPRFRLLLFFYFGPLTLFLLAKGRGYYMLPAYTPLYAAGAVWLENRLESRTPRLRILVFSSMAGLFVAGACVISIMMLPIARPGSALFAYQMRTSSDMRDETGWPELVQQVARVRDSLSASERAHLGVIAGNYGEAGALALYGPQYGLPYPISTTNSFYYRGPPEPEPETVITIGEDPEEMRSLFVSCAVAGYLETQHKQPLRDAEDGPILVCQHLREPWKTVWRTHQSFG